MPVHEFQCNDVTDSNPAQNSPKAESVEDVQLNLRRSGIDSPIGSPILRKKRTPLTGNSSPSTRRIRWDPSIRDEATFSCEPQVIKVVVLLVAVLLTLPSCYYLMFLWEGAGFKRHSNLSFALLLIAATKLTSSWLNKAMTEKALCFM